MDSLLRRGDLVRVVFPSFRGPLRGVTEGLEVLRQPFSGLRVEVGPCGLRQREHDPYADVEVRLQSLLAALYAEDVRAVWFGDGGAGASYLLPGLAAAWASRPWPTTKVVIGFSDVTALLLWLSAKGHPSFYGQPVTTRGDVDATDLRTALWFLLEERKYAGSRTVVQTWGADVIREGTARGPLLPGCFSLHAQLRGTPYEPSYEGALLLLEDHGPPTPGQHEYLLWEKLASFELGNTWARAGACVWGDADAQVAGPYAEPSDLFLPVHEVLRAALTRSLPGFAPLATGAPFGDSGMPTLLPFGVAAELDVRAGDHGGYVRLTYDLPDAWFSRR